MGNICSSALGNRSCGDKIPTVSAVFGRFVLTPAVIHAEESGPPRHR